MNAKPKAPDGFATVVEMRQALRARVISARELLELHQQRIARLDGPLNSVVVKNFDAAAGAALESDRRLAAGEERPSSAARAR